MLLDADASKGGKLVFSLEKELSSNQKRVAVTQAVTLDRTRPDIGLKGRHGLFGSQEWWDNIAAGVVPLMRVSGKILKAYRVGRDDDRNNTVELVLSDGSVKAVGIYVNSRNDISLFIEGSWLDMIYALEELKVQPAKDGGVNYSKVALEAVITPSKPE
ncbi:hypothetical protein [Stenotrophomonas sp.]|uniref:hypothetical protein n=1 Tax=Stenotrophomonas sp. TaxID=69392 RepID=UPI002898C90E|nr:hypothetical protein [Stenotrophomonas sp.]